MALYFNVPSSRGQALYRVTLEPADQYHYCECPGFQRQQPKLGSLYCCKHIRACNWLICQGQRHSIVALAFSDDPERPLTLAGSLWQSQPMLDWIEDDKRHWRRQRGLPVKEWAPK